jgi:hypothetical protein
MKDAFCMTMAWVENGDKHPKTTNPHQTRTKISKTQMFSK